MSCGEHHVILVMSCDPFLDTHCCTIQRSYSEELTIRRTIINDVMTAGNEVKTNYSSAWLHEPFINCSNCDHLLYLVLVMSGNKIQ